jgi:hypothetical protein
MELYFVYLIECLATGRSREWEVHWGIGREWGVVGLAEGRRISSSRDPFGKFLQRTEFLSLCRSFLFSMFSMLVKIGRDSWKTGGV